MSNNYVVYEESAQDLIQIKAVYTNCPDEIDAKDLALRGHFYDLGIYLREVHLQWIPPVFNKEREGLSILLLEELSRWEGEIFDYPTLEIKPFGFEGPDKEDE